MIILYYFATIEIQSTTNNRTMKTKKPKFSVGDRICAVNITNGLPEWFEIQEVKMYKIFCKSLVWNASTRWGFLKTDVIGYSDL